MKRIVFLVLAVTVLLAVAAPAVVAAPPGRPFVGVWQSIDPWDLSQQRMVITAPGRALKGYQVSYRDDGASVCGTDALGQPLYAATGKGTGYAVIKVLTTQMDIWCLARPRFFWGTVASNLAYDATTDTLSEFSGGLLTVWSRQGGK